MYSEAEKQQLEQTGILIVSPGMSYYQPLMPTIEMVEVLGGGYTGWCCDCKKDLPPLKTSDLPSGAPLRDQQIPINIAKFKMLSNGERRDPALICLQCAMMYTEVHGFWGEFATK